VGVADRGALEAAVAVARAHGLRCDDAVILRDQLNVLVHLRPAPVVARVAGTIATVRPGATWQRRELAITAHLAEAGAPVVAPSDELPPGPHEHDGRVVSFFEHVEVLDTPADPDAAGEGLRFCHEALREFRGSLPVLGGVTEAEALLAKLAAEESIADTTAHELLERILELHATLGALRSPIQPLHGDAHLNNVLNTARGPLWNDWEDTCLGPLGWDAACLTLTRDGGERAKAALAASGVDLDPGELALWVEARSLQLAVWRAYLASTS
jgi:Ser/Thr protein kinase RdoA (MazF antagonist)